MSSSRTSSSSSSSVKMKIVGIDSGYDSSQVYRDDDDDILERKSSRGSRRSKDSRSSSHSRRGGETHDDENETPARNFSLQDGGHDFYESHVAQRHLEQKRRQQQRQHQQQQQQSPDSSTRRGAHRTSTRNHDHRSPSYLVDDSYEEDNNNGFEMDSADGLVVVRVPSRLPPESGPDYACNNVASRSSLSRLVCRSNDAVVLHHPHHSFTSSDRGGAGAGPAPVADDSSSWRRTPLQSLLCYRRSSIWSHYTSSSEDSSSGTSTAHSSAQQSNNECIEHILDDDSKPQSFPSTRELFDYARDRLHNRCSGPLFRLVLEIYAGRSLFVLLLAHVVASLCIWTHYSLIKWQEKQNAVPQDTTEFALWKQIVATINYGAMHVILFQMALLPLTMAKYCIAALGGSSNGNCSISTILNRFVPINRMLNMHIYLGSCMIALVFLASTLYITFFSVLCLVYDEQEYCTKLTSEIMCSGYAILACLGLVAATSYLRHVIPHEVFHAVHYFVFILYALTIVHTMDQAHRSGEQTRSQTFKWFSSTILFYLCDRSTMYLNHKYQVGVVSSSAITTTRNNDNDDGDAFDEYPCLTSRMLLVKIRRPVLFHFQPGQYVQLQIPKIDSSWHSFYIASSPDATFLEFYIQVFQENKSSWTSKLCRLLHGLVDSDDEETTSSRGAGRKGGGDLKVNRLEIDIMGPYGTSLAKTEDYSHVVAIGADAGIVPIVSLFKQHVAEMLRLDPRAHFRLLEERQQQILDIHVAEQRRKGSVAKQLTEPCCSRRRQHENDDDSTVDEREERRNLKGRNGKPISSSSRSSNELCRSNKQLKEAASNAKRSLYDVLALAILTAFGVTLLALTISWNTIPIELYSGMVNGLKLMTMMFQLCYALIAIFFWDGDSFFTILDMALVVVSPAADIYWFGVYNTSDDGTLGPVDILTFSLLIGFMTGRVWAMAVRPHACHQAALSGISSQPSNLERLDVIWVSSSASLLAAILPDVEEVYRELSNKWEETNARRACRVSVYCTDADPNAKELLQTSNLYQQGMIQFAEPDFAEILQDHTLDLIETRQSSQTLVAFSGSSQLARELHQCKISNDMVTATADFKSHQIEFVSEIHGSVKSPKTTTRPTFEIACVQPHKGIGVNRLLCRSQREILDETDVNDSFSNTYEEDLVCW